MYNVVFRTEVTVEKPIFDIFDSLCKRHGLTLGQGVAHVIQDYCRETEDCASVQENTTTPEDIQDEFGKKIVRPEKWIANLETTESLELNFYSL